MVTHEYIYELYRKYGIEDPFPDFISKLRRFMGGYGVPVVGCQEPLVVRMP